MDFDWKQAVVAGDVSPVNADRATFEMRPEVDEEATQREGRPIHRMVEYVRIECGGDRFNIVEKKVRDEHRQRYAARYQAFREQKDQDLASGTLLEATGLIPQARVEDLKYFKIRTVEQFAAVSDGNLPNLGPGALEERRRCRDYIEAAKGTAPIRQVRAELEKRDETIELLKKQLAEQAARIDSLMGDKKVSAPLPFTDSLEANGVVAPEPKKRGRKPKAKAEAPQA